MDTIVLDDTITDNDASVYIIDENPQLGNIEKIIYEVPKSDDNIMEEVTNHQNSKKRTRSISKKRSELRGRKKKSVIPARPKENWVLLGSCSNSSLTTQRQAEGGNLIKAHDAETILILSGDEQDENVIELSDEEIGMIGGELSAAVIDSQSRLLFQDQSSQHFVSRTSHLKKMANSFIASSTSHPTSSKAAKFGYRAPPEVSSPRSLRPIVIDGSNVAFGHGHSTNFSSKGLEICCKYFRDRGHSVKIFIPQFRRRHRATSDTHILDKLEKEKIVVFTPSRNINGKSVASYDDRFIVEYATKCGGVIVSRDNYHDLISENAEWKQTINERLLMFTWVDDIIMFPQDPLGRNGPTLEEFLSFPLEKLDNKNSPTDNATNKK